MPDINVALFETSTVNDNVPLLSQWKLQWKLLKTITTRLEVVDKSTANSIALCDHTVLHVSQRRNTMASPTKIFLKKQNHILPLRSWKVRRHFPLNAF